MHVLPLSKCGRGKETPWHCRQFMPGSCHVGIDVARSWLGVARWQVAQSSLLLSEWHDTQWLFVGWPQAPAWLCGRVSWWH